MASRRSDTEDEKTNNMASRLADTEDEKTNKMASRLADTEDEEDSREKRSFEKLFELFQEVDFCLPDDEDKLDGDHRRLMKQLETCEQYESDTEEVVYNDIMDSLHQSIQNNEREIDDMADSTESLLDDVNKAISKRKKNIASLRDLATRADLYKDVGKLGRLTGAMTGLVGGACLLAAPFTGGASLAAGGLFLAAGAAESIGGLVVEGFGTKAQVDKANELFKEDKDTIDNLVEAIDNFTAKYERFLVSLYSSRMLGELKNLTANIAMVGMLATFPVLTVLAQNVLKESLKQTGKHASKKSGMEAARVVTKEAGKHVMRQAGKFALASLAGVFVIIDLWELINVIKELGKVSEVTTELRRQAKKLKESKTDLDKYLEKLIKQLDSLKRYKKKMNKLETIASDVLSVTARISGFEYLMKALKSLIDLKDEMDDEEEEEDEDSNEEEETRYYQVATLNVRSLGAKSRISKPGFIRKKIQENNTDILFISETWFQRNDEPTKKILQEACPDGFTYINHPFLSERPRCGVAIIFDAEKFKIDGLRFHDYGVVGDGGITGVGATFSSAEPDLDLSFKTASIYCHPEHGSMRTECKRLMYIFMLYCEIGIEDIFYMLIDLLANCKTHPKESIIGGDLNIHVNKSSNIALAFKSLTKACGFKYIPKSKNIPNGTHVRGNILDLIISRTKLQSVLVDEDPAESEITDHYWVQGKVEIKGKSKE